MGKQGKAEQLEAVVETATQSLAAALEGALDDHAPARAAEEDREAIAEVLEPLSAPLAILEETAENVAKGVAASLDVDAAEWAKKSFELWAENASALAAFASDLAQAGSMAEIIELQGRFARERFEAMLRQSREVMELTSSMARFSAGPLCDVSRRAA